MERWGKLTKSTKKSVPVIEKVTITGAYLDKHKLSEYIPTRKNVMAKVLSEP